MSILFSRHCEYALQAITYIAMKPANSAISIKELSEALDIPFPFLAKILQDLKAKRLVFSLRGPNGGFGLAKESKHITLLQVVQAIDGLDFTNRCVMGFTHCNDSTPCATHSQWKHLRQGIHAMLAKQNLSEVAREMKRSEFAHARLFLPTNRSL